MRALKFYFVRQTIEMLEFKKIIRDVTYADVTF